MASNMYTYNRPTEGGVLNITENGSVSLAGANYSEINVNVSGGGSLGAGVNIVVRKTGVSGHLSFNIQDFSWAYLNAQPAIGSDITVPSGIEYLLSYPSDGTNYYEFSDGNVSAVVSTDGTQTAFTDFTIVEITFDGETAKCVKFTPSAPSAGDFVTYMFTIGDSGSK